MCVGVSVSEEAGKSIPIGALPPEHYTLGIGCEMRTNTHIDMACYAVYSHFTSSRSLRTR